MGTINMMGGSYIRLHFILLAILYSIVNFRFCMVSEKMKIVIFSSKDIFRWLNVITLQSCSTFLASFGQNHILNRSIRTIRTIRIFFF